MTYLVKGCQTFVFSSFFPKEASSNDQAWMLRCADMSSFQLQNGHPYAVSFPVTVYLARSKGPRLLKNTLDEGGLMW